VVKLLIVLLVVVLLVSGTASAKPQERVTKTLEIDADIYSPHFGEPIDAQAGGQQ